MVTRCLAVKDADGTKPNAHQEHGTGGMAWLLSHHILLRLVIFRPKAPDSDGDYKMPSGPLGVPHHPNQADPRQYLAVSCVRARAGQPSSLLYTGRESSLYRS